MSTDRPVKDSLADGLLAARQLRLQQARRLPQVFAALMVLGLAAGLGLALTMLAVQ